MDVDLYTNSDCLPLLYTGCAQDEIADAEADQIEGKRHHTEYLHSLDVWCLHSCISAMSNLANMNSIETILIVCTMCSAKAGERLRSQITSSEGQQITSSEGQSRIMNASIT